MKYLISSVTIGACLLLSSAGDVFAQNPHTPGTPTGQLGTTGPGGSITGVASCGGSQTSPPGQVSNPTTNNSPFPVGSPPTVNTSGSVSKYAAGTNPHANSQYDVACLQQQLH